MEYDPIKNALGRVFNRTPALRVLFYHLLDILLLRTWHVHKALRKIRRTLPETSRILDAGSGFGQYDYYMARKMPHSQILAVDIKEDQIADCSRFFAQIGLPQVRFEVADLTQYMAPDAYHLILSVDVMEHILEDTLVLTHFHRSLQAGGTLLLSTPSERGAQDEQTGSGSFIGEHVRCGYAVADMRDKLVQAGFQDIRIRYTYGVPGRTAWHLSMKYPVLLLGKSRWFFVLLPFYYVIFFPFCLILNYLDVSCRHRSGSGLLVEARK